MSSRRDSGLCHSGLCPSTLEFSWPQLPVIFFKVYESILWKTNVTYKSGAKPKRRVVGAVTALIDQFMLKYVGSNNSVIDVNNEI